MDGETTEKNELYTKRVYEYDQIINQLLKHEQNILFLLKKGNVGDRYDLFDDRIHCKI